MFNKSCTVAFMLPLLIVLILNEVKAQTGFINGTVSDEATEEFLEGANLHIQEAGHKVTTDSEGRYTLRQVPSGENIIEISRAGYKTLLITVSIDDGKALEKDIKLAAELFDGGYQHGQARSITKQRESMNIKSVISSEQINRFADYTVQDVMARIPGVQVGSSGEVNIRGTGHDRYSVMIDGQRMASTGLGTRAMDLDLLPADMVQELEVVKVISPDMDADALAGAINIHTHKPAKFQRYLNARVGGITSPAYFKYMGVGSRASLHYAESPRDDLSIALSLSHHSVQRPKEGLEINYEVADFNDGSGPVDVIDKLSPYLHIYEHNKTAGNLHVTFQPSAGTTYYVYGMTAIDNRDMSRHTTRFISAGDWISQDFTGLLGAQGGYGYDALAQETNIRQYQLQAGAKHELTRFDIDYNIGWAQSNVSQEEFVFPFQIDGMNYAINMDDRMRPTMHIIDFPLLLDGTIDRQQIRFQNMDSAIDDHIDNTYSARFDVEIPVDPISLQFGSAAKSTNKTGNFSDANLRYIGILNLSRFNMIQDGAYNVLDEYFIPWLLNTDNARTFIKGVKPTLVKDHQAYYRNSEIWNYEISEEIYAGYGMATVRLGPFTILGGVRVEYTDSKNEGKKLIFNHLDRFESSSDTSETNNYTNVFPNAQMVFRPSESYQVRVAYSRTISKPSFNITTPFEFSNASDSTLFRGNTRLDPLLSDNIDIQIERYFGNNGFLSLGLFQKQLSGFVFQKERKVVEGDFGGWNERIYMNREETATLYGIEFSLQQNFSFLPGFLKNFGIIANYTWSHSIFELDHRSEDVTLAAQSPHVINTALYFNRGRFFTLAAYHWTDTSLSHIKKNPQIAPSVNQSEEVYLDQYEDGARDISVSFGFKISNNFQFWADAHNLLSTERVLHKHTREYYPHQIGYRDGFGFRAGLQFIL